ncbi:unnamed protein product [Clonostachys rosea]|uniref:Major facilitator superfamily (MFS) profile domain-containing protein n=1 Tax=Bionectria ochroleuca TaxID=29856 RepID=A0ABY6U0R6_BIOOC|nr:unnamed protein product [Clonostachys rosea]
MAQASAELKVAIAGFPQPNSKHESILIEQSSQNNMTINTLPRVGWFRLVAPVTILTSRVKANQYPGHGSMESPYLVRWLQHDQENPLNFPVAMRWVITCLAALSCFTIALTSSAYTGGIASLQSEFGISNSVAQLGVSLYVLGFAIGPLISAPLSEIYGRQSVFFVTYGLLVVFNAASASAKTLPQLLVFRALAGAIGSSPLANAGGLIADIFEADNRGLAMGLFSFGPYMGPVVGPIVGGFMGEAAGWRWPLWFCTILCGVVWILCVSLTPETYAPVLLERRAAALTASTGRLHISGLQHGPNTRKLSILLKQGLSRPWVLLFSEPIVLLLSLFMAVVYATLYMLFAAFPIVFREQRGWSIGESGLAFTAMAIGMCAALGFMIIENQRYRRRVQRSPGGGTPEMRLPVCIVGGIFVPAGLFLFAWTNNPNIHWSVCLLGTVLFGFGNVLITLGCFNYLVDSYLIYTSSCMAGSSLLRSVLGAAFPLFTANMYHRLGSNWASSIPAFLALACAPLPFIFMKYGLSIRKRCKYSAKAQELQERMKASSVTDNSEGS